MPATSGWSAPKSTAPEALRLGVLAVLALTLYRVVLLAFASADLFVDEAQYWAWGQNLEFGYYSKPPLIGWVIRAFTEVAGSDAPFWIRLPGPLFHGAAALVVLATARRLWGDVAGAATGIAYASMPGVALGALLISTDTILLPFFALALFFWLKLTERSSAGVALAMGAAVGLGMMAKYAAIYFVLGALFSVIFVRGARISWRDAALAALAFLVVFAPNILWNLQNGLTTVSHTADNVDWINDPSTRLRLNFSGLAEFFGGQFGVMGPVFFAAYLVVVARKIVTGDWPARWLIWMSLPIILLVCVQAILSRAYANWAAPAYVAAVILTAPWLFDRARRIYCAALGINLALSLALPLAAVFATSWTLNDRLVLGRYVGRAEASARILSTAREAGLTDVVATSRDLLADLFHAAKGTGIAPWSVPFEGHVPHYYAQRFPYPTGQSAPALYADFADVPPLCAPGTEVTELTRWDIPGGAYRGRTLVAWRVGPGCWTD
ncbi:ArnT family glycosyltransferase [Marinibacterium profundimaris]|uniref:ArnT family glycosyltransferase n=1 Tax=Marinibacterium profundimaris TaxID=1679460 RepID=UPI001303F3E7|nr:glycosyltransferase family 39 protein [Marinibacterium profundimaris]